MKRIYHLSGNSKKLIQEQKVKKKIFQNFLELIKEEQLHDKVGLGR
jgi:hypothetical protein